VAKGAISDERAKFFRRSVQTVAGDMSEDFYKVCVDKLSKEIFLQRYGHLRPSSYDLLSPTYENRKDLFNGNPLVPNKHEKFELTEEERGKINILLAEHG